MYYTIYKITNKLDGKIYIGAHKTSNLDDGYMGSGKYLISAQNKHGIENFEKEILEVFDNPETMFEMESILVNQEFVERADTYNIKPGGEGGFDYINSLGGQGERLNKALSQEKRKFGSKKAISKRTATIREKRKIDPEFEKHYMDIRTRAFKGQKHSDEAKQKIGEANSKHQQGEGNSQYGLMWIYSLTEKISKRIRKEDFPQWEAEGWLQGRKMKF